jgi:hypothetical protein
MRNALYRTLAMLKVILGLSLGATGAMAFEECKMPESPAIPDGKTVIESELLKAQKAVKDYIAGVEGYLACTEREQAKAQALALRSSLPFSAAEQQIWANRYNAGIDAQVKVADRFNAEVKVWRAKSAEAKSDPAKK